MHGTGLLLAINLVSYDASRQDLGAIYDVTKDKSTQTLCTW